MELGMVGETARATPMPAIAQFLLVVLMLAAGACGTAEAPSVLTKPIPTVGLGGLTETGRSAVAAAQSAAVAAPNRVEAVAEFGRHLHAYGFLPAASDLYARAEALDSEDYRWPYLTAVVLQQQNEYSAAVAPLERALARKPQFTAAEVRLAESLRETGALDESYAVFSGVRRRHPDLARAYLGLGQVDAAAERYERSIPKLRRAIELAPEAGGSYLALALVLRALGRPAESHEQLQHYRQRLPENPPVADPLVESIAQLRTDWPDLWEEASACEESLNLPRARELYNELLAWPQGRWRAHAALVRISASIGDFAAAETHYLQASALHPDAEEVLYSRGFALYEEELYTEAQEVFRRALELDPRSRRVHVELARTLRRIGLILEAEQHEQEAAALRSISDIDAVTE